MNQRQRLPLSPFAIFPVAKVDNHFRVPLIGDENLEGTVVQSSALFL